MLIAVLVAGSLVYGLDLRIVALMTASALEPGFVLVAVVAWAGFLRFRQHRALKIGPETEAAYLSAVASELRAGASLRAALVDAGARAPRLELSRLRRRVAAGLPIERIAEELGRMLPTNGHLAAGAVGLAGSTGARVADAFDALSERAAFVVELDRDLRVATAQARLSAAVVAGAPMVFLAALLVSGRAADLLEHGAVGMGILGIGLGFEAAGLAVVVAMLRGAR